MNGPIAQITALTCHANAFLQNGTAPEFFPTNTTCKFCDLVDFADAVIPFLGKVVEKLVARTPNAWFQYLKDNDGIGIRLAPQGGFIGGGGTWTMEVLLPRNKSLWWMARWEVWNQNAPDRRIWRVRYSYVAKKESTRFAAVDLDSATHRLLHSLREIHAFSERNDCGGFTNCFANAIDTLTGGPSHGFHSDLAPSGFLSNGGSVLLDGCQSAWVFGGMGSWNDMGFDGAEQKEYDRVSEQLYSSLTEAICIAANSSIPHRRLFDSVKFL